MQKWFTADFHLGSEKVLKTFQRPFKDIYHMNEHLVACCNVLAPNVDDWIYHIGDLYCYKRDGEYDGMDIPWDVAKNDFRATLLPLKGNHDENNGVKTIASSMRMVLGGRFNCVLCHFPSYDKRTSASLIPGDINICGHAHTAWLDQSEDGRYFIDKERRVLNINVGVDVWGYKPISEVTLVNYITHTMAALQRKKQADLVASPL